MKKNVHVKLHCPHITTTWMKDFLKTSLTNTIATSLSVNRNFIVDGVFHTACYTTPTTLLAIKFFICLQMSAVLQMFVSSPNS